MEFQEADDARTEKATQHKRTEARRRGQVAKSVDFNSMIVIGGFFGLLTMGASGIVAGLGRACTALFAGSGEAADGLGTMTAAGAEFSRAFIAAMQPVALAAVAFPLIAHLLQAGVILSIDPLKPEFSRLNPLSGFKRIYNQRVFFEAFKALIKLALFIVVISGFFSAVWFALPSLQHLSVLAATAWFLSSAATLAMRVIALFALFAMLDLLWTRWRYGRQLMMSRRELKEESRRREGDPLLRRRLRELQRENLKQARAISRVGDADVVITNPEHVAVALRYRRATMSAPEIVARGADLWAQEMKRRARLQGVPILERRALARLLYAKGMLSATIPVETYHDVASIYSQLPPMPASPAITPLGASIRRGLET